MEETTGQSFCDVHPDRTAVDSCGYCGKPVCQACIVESVANEQTFCSERCRDAAPGETGQETISNEVLETGLEKPIRMGWALWGRSAGRISSLLAPVSALAALIGAFMIWSVGNPASPFPDAIVVYSPFLLMLCFAFSVALVGVILSVRHAGLFEGNLYLAAARRFIPWLATWLMMVGIILAGYVALIIPGIYLALRFFWADEFALLHNQSPLKALRSSWELTRGRAGDVFKFQFILGFAQYLVIVPAIILGVLLVMGIDALGLNSETFPWVLFFLYFLAGSVVYGAMHGPEVVQFYGMRAAKSRIEAGIDPATRKSTRDWVFTTVTSLAAVAGIGFFAWLAVPSFLEGIDRGNQRRTYDDSHELAVMMETYLEINGQYPIAGDVAELENLFVPEYIDTMSVVDGWGRPFRIDSTPLEYEIRSAGKDGVFETVPPRGATFDPDDDIVWRDGELVQWPGYFVFD